VIGWIGALKSPDFEAYQIVTSSPQPLMGWFYSSAGVTRFFLFFLALLGVLE